ncbi:MAG: hypothetical protein JOZ59_04765 [Candidatus Eremiobacteraeota bacterium]|nr:hypothetical protein [Candidatus Eremiobacteraeota bacterium]
MRYFFSTGEPSAELSATDLATEIAARVPDARFEGIGSQRMRNAGFELWADHRGWSSILPFSVLAKVPRVYLVWLRTLRRLLHDPPERVILVDFGAFNLRLSKALRERGYRGSIIYYFPPGAWFDKPDQARSVARTTTPLPAFQHQYEFYRELGLEAHYFGHPLASKYLLRPMRSTPPHDGGIVALLPGSRAAELQHHVPLLLDALERLRSLRPNVQAHAVAADESAARSLRQMMHRQNASVEIVHGTQDALETADAAWIASGTAVLEAALLGVPAVVFYRMAAFQMRVVRHLYRGRYMALSNLIAGREIVPEFAQETAHPDILASAMHSLLNDPQPQYDALRGLRSEIGGGDTLPRIADFVVSQRR